MAPGIKESGLDDSIKVENLVSFFEAKGHNLIAFGDIDSRRHLRNLALHFGVDYEPFHHELVDVEDMYTSMGHPWLYSSNLFKPLVNLQDPVFTPESKVAYQGIGQTLDPENSFVFPIVHGEISTQSRAIKDGGPADPEQPNSVSGE